MGAKGEDITDGEEELRQQQSDKSNLIPEDDF